MSVFHAIRAGVFAVGRRKKIVWTWYALSLLCAVAVIAPIVAAIAAFLGTSLENPRLFENFDVSFIAEFGWNSHWDQFALWIPVVAAAGGVFVLLTTWLSGGALAVLRDPSESFFAGCARWFPPFLRLALFSLLGYGIAYGCWGLASMLVSKIARDSMSAKPSALGSMTAFVSFCVAFLFVNLLADYAKVYMVARGDRAARRGIRGAFRFVFANFRRTVGIYAVLTGGGLLMLGVYHGVSEAIGQGSLGAVLLLFVIRQVYTWGRTWLRFVFLASEHAYFVSLMPVPAPLEESLEFNESV